MRAHKHRSLHANTHTAHGGPCIAIPAISGCSNSPPSPLCVPYHWYTVVAAKSAALLRYVEGGEDGFPVLVVCGLLQQPHVVELGSARLHVGSDHPAILHLHACGGDGGS